MKILLLISFLFLISCSKNTSNPNEGKENWAFVNCINSSKVTKKCNKIKDFTGKVQCMSSLCGRPNPKLEILEVIQIK